MKTETIDIKVSGLKRFFQKYIWRMDVEKPAISLTPDALVFLYSSKKDYTSIPWSEINEFQFIKDELGPGVIPMLKDPQKYIDACTSKVIKFGMKHGLEKDGSPFNIRVNNLDHSPDEIANLVDEYLKENGSPEEQ